jgi:hypothetical protein
LEYQLGVKVGGMKRRKSLLTVASGAAFLFLSTPQIASADDPAGGSGESVDLQGAGFLVLQPGLPANPPGGSDAADVAYEYEPTCGLGGQAICYEGTPCVADTVEGVKYDVFLDGEKVGEVCVTEQQAAEVEVVTPGRVLEAFRSLEWPSSELVVQPPDGQTLVNFPTIFYTDNAAPSRQRVTLLRQGVLIEATPTTYTWRFGDGTSTSTATPGAAYPAMEVTHDYATVGTFSPSVDTTYTGRYRLAGGPWVAIPETLTVPGAAQVLETVEARPTLVDY